MIRLTITTRLTTTITKSMKKSNKIRVCVCTVEGYEREKSRSAKRAAGANLPERCRGTGLLGEGHVWGGLQYLKDHGT